MLKNGYEYGSITVFLKRNKRLMMGERKKYYDVMI